MNAGARIQPLWWFALWAWGSSPLVADDPSLAVERIPEGLRKGAKAVVRRHEVTFEASRGGGGTLTVRRAVTVFEPSARTHGTIVVWYDGFESVEDIEGTILDATGEEVSSLSASDFDDRVGFDGFSLAQDVRVKLGQIAHSTFPYTVVYEYEIERAGTFSWPSWVAHPTRDPVEHARFEVRVPEGRSLRWWCNQDTVKPKVSVDKRDSVYVWEYDNLPALPAEEGWDDWDDATVSVRTAPNEFTMEGRSGSLGSWSDLGSWFYSLYVTRQALPPEAIRDVQATVAGVTDPSEKVDRVYRYMQGRTRYVSIQLGLGGWQPFDASVVHEKGYGDCKALSNYTIALLNAVGIKAYPVKLHTGYVRRPFIEDFPSQQFNHVIACVPLEQDTVWLECTSQSLGPGRLGGSSESRLALLLTASGGRVVRLPGSAAERNRLTRTVVMNVQPSGAVTADVRVTFTGNQHDRFQSRWEDLSADDRSRSILQECGMAEASMASFSIDSSQTGRDVATVAFSVELPNYGSKTGQRIFLPAEPFERHATPPRTVERRLSPVNLRYRYLDIDSALIRLPDGYLVEMLPKGSNLSASFAQFKASVVRLDNGDIQLTRTLRVTDPMVPAKHYEEFRSFFQEVARADRAQIVLLRKAQ